MQSERLAALLADSRLSDSARVIAFWLELQTPAEDGFVPMAYAVIAPMLHGIPSTETVGKHVRMLEGCGWLERRPGGRGQPDQFRIAPPSNQGLSATMEQTAQHLAPGKTPGLNIDTGFEGGAKSDSPPLETPPKSYSPGLQGGSMSSNGGVGGEVGEEDRLKGEDATRVRAREGRPVGKKKYELATDAEEVIDDRLKGCRDTLRDYLQVRVPPDRQRWYVQAVATMLEGGDPAFVDSEGNPIVMEDRPRLVAKALNDLLITGEEGARKPMARPDGDPANLRTKISILAKPFNRKRGKDPAAPEKPKRPGINERWRGAANG